MIAYLYQKGALNGFIFWNIAGNYQYVSEGSTNIKLARQLLTRVLPYVASTALIWVLATIGSIRLFFRGHTLNSELSVCPRQEWLIVLWFVLSIIPVSTGFRFYGHYFLLLLPPMAILASPVIENIWRENRVWLKRVSLVAILLPAIGFTVARFYIADIHAKVGEDNIENYKPLASYVKEHTAPDDRVLAWGYAPLVYWYSERLPATRFFWSDLLTGRVPGTKGGETGAKVDPKMWEMFFNDIERHKPAYIIDTAPADLHDYKDFPVTRYPRLMEYLNQHYRLETSLNNALFYHRLD